LGDSISLHYGPFLKERLSGVAVIDSKADYAEALENLDLPSGANGGDSSTVERFLQHLVKDRPGKPDWLILNCGLHDLKSVAAEAGWPATDLHRFTRSLPGNPFCDHVHFTPAVREQQAAYLTGSIALLFNLPPSRRPGA